MPDKSNKVSKSIIDQIMATINSGDKGQDVQEGTNVPGLDTSAVKKYGKPATGFIPRGYTGKEAAKHLGMDDEPINNTDEPILTTTTDGKIGLLLPQDISHWIPSRQFRCVVKAMMMHMAMSIEIGNCPNPRDTELDDEDREMGVDRATHMNVMISKAITGTWLAMRWGVPGEIAAALANGGDGGIKEGTDLVGAVMMKMCHMPDFPQVDGFPFTQEELDLGYMKGVDFMIKRFTLETGEAIDRDMIEARAERYARALGIVDGHVPESFGEGMCDCEDCKAAERKKRVDAIRRKSSRFGKTSR